MTVEKTLALIKPDATRRGHAQEIKRMIEAKGFLIICKEKVQLSRAAATRFYQEHEGKDFFPNLLNFMTSGPVWALVLQKANAIGAWREMMGPTNTQKAKEEAPDSLRAMFGTDGTQNATHGSDSPASAEREIRFFFPGVPVSCGPTGLPTIEWTLAMIKPDAVKKGKAEEIKQLIQLNGFTIVAQHKIQLTRMRAEEFYAEHQGKDFFPNLVDFMTSGPIWALVLSKCNAITGWRQMMGPTNTLKARQEAPKCLRALYGTDGTQNATHGSDSPESAKREIKFFFPQLVLEPLSNDEAAKEYISTQLQPALAKALTALAREKPSAERFEAITFLADFLLNNNPNKPRIIMPDEWDPSMEEEDEEEEFHNAKLAGAIAAQELASHPQPPASLASGAEVDAAASSGLPPPAPRAPSPATSAPATGSRPASGRPGSRGSASGADARQEEAATTVQAAFRGNQARMELDEATPEPTPEPAIEPAPEPAADPSLAEEEPAPEPAPAEEELSPEPAAEPAPAEEEHAPVDVEATPAEAEAPPAEEAGPASRAATPSEAAPAEEEDAPAEAEVPLGKADVPYAEDEAPPAEEEATPSEDEAAPSEAALSSRAATPNEAAPDEAEAASAETEAPPAEEAAPAVEEAPVDAAPASRAATPDEVSPAAEEAAPAEAEAAPASRAATPDEGQESAVDEELAAADEEAAPADEEAAPADGEAVPAEDEPAE